MKMKVSAGVLWKLAGFLAYHGQADLWQMLQRARQTGGQPPPPAVLFEYMAHMLPGHDFVLCLDNLQCVSADALLEEFLAKPEASRHVRPVVANHCSAVCPRTLSKPLKIARCAD